MKRVLVIFAGLSLLGSCARYPAGNVAIPAGDWPAYGRTALGDRHSPLTQITPGNAAQLEVAWRFHTGETAPQFATRAPSALEVTPLVIAGTMYASTPLGRVFALDPLTGVQRWSYDPRVDRTIRFGDFNNRGVSYWRDPAPDAARCAARIFLASIDSRLIALDAATGVPCPNFGNNGAVSLLDGLRNAPNRPDEYEQTSPPAVINGLVIVGSAVADNNRIDAASGEVRAFDARTGLRRWTWHPVPQDPADPGFRTWIGPMAHRSGAANAWSVIAADPARDLVFIPTSSPSVDYYGGERKGQNLYANSIVALRAATGRVVWHFQTIHHDLWDYDNAAPPALVTIERGGARIPAVLQATKSGQLFVLHRETGKPLFPVEERAVPASDVAGEEAHPTQPISAGLPPLSPQRITAADIWGVTPADSADCAARVASLRNDGPFTPPSLRGSVNFPANVGGAHWGGLSYDRDRQIVVVPTNRIAAVITLVPRAAYESSQAETRGERIGLEYAMMRGTPYVLKREVLTSSKGSFCTRPPLGSLSGISLRTGRELWSVPLGTPEGLEKLGLPTSPYLTGAINLGGPITTASGLTFIGATTDAYFRAYETATGRELWKAKLPAGGKATPMTFLGADGRQYVVIAAGGDGKVFGKSDEIIAFSLPRSR